MAPQSKKRQIISLVTEYKPVWLINRSLYSTKLKLLSKMPYLEKLFEKKVNIQRTDMFDINVGAIKRFLKTLSEEKKSEILEIADNAVKGMIKGFSSIMLDYGDPINWHCNPLTGVECPKNVKWYKIPDFDSARGDIKAVWEASRFTHFYFFARAYLISGDTKYYNAFSTQLGQWLEKNPYPYGPNYKCGQECALRMINALFVFGVFKASGITDEYDENNVSKLVEVCYRKILSNFFYAHKCIKNNHTLSEICGLIIGAWCCNDRSGVLKGYKLFDREIRMQFFPDGGYKQFSVNYHRFALQIVECVHKLGEKTGLTICEMERIVNSVKLLYQMQADNGALPNYGANDGALIFPVTACDYRDFRPVLNSVYMLMKGERLYGHGEYDEEFLWFGNEIDSLYSGIERRSSAFNNSGIFTLRHTKGFILTYLQDFKSRPGHMDQLHVDLWHKNVNILCDSGTYSYASDLGNELCLTSGHNTVMVSNIEQMSKLGAFLIYGWTWRRAVRHDGESFCGTMVSRNGYEHTRSIEKSASGYVIHDSDI